MFKAMHTISNKYTATCLFHIEHLPSWLDSCLLLRPITTLRLQDAYSDMHSKEEWNHPNGQPSWSCSTQFILYLLHYVISNINLIGLVFVCSCVHQRLNNFKVSKKACDCKRSCLGLIIYCSRISTQKWNMSEIFWHSKLPFLMVCLMKLSSISVNAPLDPLQTSLPSTLEWNRPNYGSKQQW